MSYQGINPLPLCAPARGLIALRPTELIRRAAIITRVAAIVGFQFERQKSEPHNPSSPYHDADHRCTDPFRRISALAIQENSQRRRAFRAYISRAFIGALPSPAPAPKPSITLVRLAAEGGVRKMTPCKVTYWAQSGRHVLFASLSQFETPETLHRNVKLGVVEASRAAHWIDLQPDRASTMPLF
jgi:hypothetical protein